MGCPKDAGGDGSGGASAVTMNGEGAHMTNGWDARKKFWFLFSRITYERAPGMTRLMKALKRGLNSIEKENKHLVEVKIIYSEAR